MSLVPAPCRWFNGGMSVKAKHKATKQRAKRCPTAKEAHAALDRIHAAAEKSGASKLTDDEIDDLIAEARQKLARRRSKKRSAKA